MNGPQRAYLIGSRAGRGKVVVGYPTGFNVTLPFHASVQRLLWYEQQKPDERRLLSRITHTSGLYVADNRTMLAQRFFDGDEEWLLQIDTDIEFLPDLLERMVEIAGEHKILAASVPLGIPGLGGYPSAGFRRSEKPGVWFPVPEKEITREPLEVDGIATACALIHREVFQAIAARHGQSWFHHIYLPESPEGTDPREFRYRSQGEDLAFSVRAKDAGHSLWIAHVEGLRHWKSMPLTHDRAPVAAESALGALVAEE